MVESINQISEVEKKLIIAEYKSLRDEIQLRLSRIFELQKGLLIGISIYITTIYVPKLLKSESMNVGNSSFFSAPLLFYLFLLILPIVAFLVELWCTSEQDAIFRAGNYIRDNIEIKFRKFHYHGWEDWLNRQDRIKRRRTSDKLTVITRRCIVVLYCFISSLICGFGLSNYFKNLSGFKLFLNFFSIYLVIFLVIMLYLYFARKDEFSNPFYNFFIVDIDGCLTDSKRKISEKNKKAIEFLNKKSVYVILATGRGSLAVKKTCNELDLKGQHVICHGASIYNASDDQEKQSDNKIVKKDDVKKIISEINRNKINWVAFGIRKYYCDKRNYSEILNKLKERDDLPDGNDDKVVQVDDIEHYEFENISKILLYVTEKEKYRNITLALSKRYKMERSTPETLEITNKNASKKSSVKEILSEYKFKKRTLVVGDYDNDIELLKWGHQAVAPSNSSQKILNMKGVNVLKNISNDEDLIWKIAEIYYNIDEEN